MDFNTLQNRKKKLHRMLNVCKQKQIACKLYLNEQPERASRGMLQYLASLENKSRSGAPFFEDASRGISILIGFVILAFILQLNFTIIYFVALVIFVFLIFLLPYYNSRRSIRKTKKYISDAELPGLQLKIKNLNNEIKLISKQIEEAAKRYQQQQSQKKTGHNSRHRLDIASALSILGLPQTANFEDAKKAFRQKIMQFHPDRTSRQSEAEQKHAAEQTVKLNQAYGHLKKVMLK